MNNFKNFLKNLSKKQRVTAVIVLVVVALIAVALAFVTVNFII